MKTDLSRLKKNIEELSSFNATPGKGITRFSYSPEDAQAREYLYAILEEMGLQIKVDAVGNVRARLQGKKREAPVIMTGSHIDSVLHGGKFDGVVGVIGGLEVLRVMIENEVELNHPLELIIFAEEEGSNFGSAMAGSKTLTGKYSLEDLIKIKNPDGVSMYEMAKAAGYSPEKCQEYLLQPGEVKAMLEMHVEQSVVLDAENIPVGIVRAIAGSKWFAVTLEGVSNHAGATPMHLRNDPMVGASRVIAQIPSIVKEQANPTTVATVGKITCDPNVPNVIPSSVTFTVDIRDVKQQGIEIVENELRKFTEDVTDSLGLQKDIALMGASEPITLSSRIIEVLEEAALSKQIKYKIMNSGAVHDACLLASVTDVGMIFVPSKNGRSHVPEESTNYEDVQRGCDILLEAILKLDGQP